MHRSIAVTGTGKLRSTVDARLGPQFEGFEDLRSIDVLGFTATVITLEKLWYDDGMMVNVITLASNNFSQSYGK